MDPPETGRIDPPLCVHMNNSFLLDLANCPSIISTTTKSKPITNSETISPQSKDSDTATFIVAMIGAIIAVVIMYLLFEITVVTVVIYLSKIRENINSTTVTQNTYDTNEAALHTSTVTIDQNAAYGATSETQGNREASSVITSENAAYGATSETQGNREASSVITSENDAYGATMETQGNLREASRVVTSENAAYGVITETQGNRETSNVVMSENAAYGAAPLSGQQ